MWETDETWKSKAMVVNAPMTNAPFARETSSTALSARHWSRLIRKIFWNLFNTILKEKNSNNGKLLLVFLRNWKIISVYFLSGFTSRSQQREEGWAQ